jgi:hypothetical protein
VDLDLVRSVSLLEHLNIGAFPSWTGNCFCTFKFTEFVLGVSFECLCSPTTFEGCIVDTVLMTECEPLASMVALIEHHRPSS